VEREAADVTADGPDQTWPPGARVLDPTAGVRPAREDRNDTDADQQQRTDECSPPHACLLSLPAA